MLKDRVGAYYLEKNYNCAETLIHAINDEYHLALGEEEMKLAGGFGGGMGCMEATCGALCCSSERKPMRRPASRSFARTTWMPSASGREQWTARH